MARELVNLSTENEKLQQQTKNYPVLIEQHKVCKDRLRWKRCSQGLISRT